MPNSRPPTIQSRIKIGALGIAVSLIALVPWWRNHDFLRDFYDYGLFINVNARLAEGQHPYADFTTPAQTAAFLLNYAAESLGGGYVGMTRGAAALIVAGGLGLTFILARRMRAWTAALLALAIVAGSASQHTIIFYNPLGVLALALVVWSFAIAPVLDRATVGWHALAAAGLFLGGVNKINFHLLACAMAVGWVIHAWMEQRPKFSRVALTLGFIGLFGFLLPMGFEVAWTGGGWRTWYYNVVQLPLSARGGRFSLLFSPRLYLTTVHDYYGTLRVVPVGLIGVLMPLCAVVAAWRSRPPTAWRMLFLLGAGLLAAFACSALLLTNNEIAYISFAASLAITIGLWLGFGAEPRGGWFAAGLLLPAAILAAAGWESAWRGQRSQFGHEGEPREHYQRGEKAGDDFGYLRGLHLPSFVVNSLADFAAWRRQLPPDQLTRIYYGPGIEWLEHIWPVHQVHGLPLIAAAFDGQREVDLFNREVLSSDAFRHLVVVEAWDSWNDPVQQQLNRTTQKERVGMLMVYHKLRANILSSRPLEFSPGIGGNVDSLRIITRLRVEMLADNRRYLGIDRGEGRVDVDTPCSRMSAEYVVTRIVRGTGGPLTVHLAASARMGESLLPRWSADAVLPEGTDELVVPVGPVDGSLLPLTFTVTVPESAAGQVRAGWRAFQLAHTADQEELPPTLQSGVAPLSPAGDAVRAVLLPAAMQPSPLFIRNVQMDNGAVLLPRGGEVWIRTKTMFTDIRISARTKEAGSGAPHVNVVYYKGGRIEKFVPETDAGAGTAHFRAWTAEYGGWIGILADPFPSTPPFTIKIDSVTGP